MDAMGLKCVSIAWPPVRSLDCCCSLLQLGGVTGLALGVIYMLQEKIVSPGCSAGAPCCPCSAWRPPRRHLPPPPWGPGAAAPAAQAASGCWQTWLIRNLCCRHEHVKPARPALPLTLARLCAPRAPQIYVPRLPGIPNEYPYLPDQWRLGYEDVWLTTADGVRLHAWLMWPEHWGAAERRSRPTVVFFQENAGNMAFRWVLTAAYSCSMLSSLGSLATPESFSAGS